MDVTVRALTNNQEVLNRCRVTVWKDGLDKEPSKIFMEKVYKSEHSPIRDKFFVIEIRGIKSWIATHFVRHSIGYTPYVSTQRDDRIEIIGSRDDRGQGELVNIDITLNAQSFISVSRKRLCLQAHMETIKTWNMVLSELVKIDEELANNCVPECIYRNGLCPEFKCCGYIHSSYFEVELNDYRKSLIERNQIFKGCI